MRLQDSQANCGPLAVRNALKALGLERSTSECEALCKTNPTEGTSATNLVKGVRKLEELCPRVIEESREIVAHLLLSSALVAGRPVITCVDNWEHMVAVVGTLGSSRILVADSADAELVISYPWDIWMQRWACIGAKKPYWGVVL